MEAMQELQDMQSVMQMYLEQMQELQTNIKESYELMEQQKAEIKQLKVEYEEYKNNLEAKLRKEQEAKLEDNFLQYCLQYFAKKEHSNEAFDLLQKCFKYRNFARIDLVNEGEGKNLELLSLYTPNTKETSNSWNTKDAWHILESDQGSIRVKYKCIGDGKLKVRIRGVDFKIDNLRLPIWVKLLSFTINGKVVFDKARLVWHDEFLGHTMDVKDGDLLDLYLKWDIAD